MHTPVSTTYHKNPRKVPNIFKDQSTKDQYQANMQEWLNTHPVPQDCSSSQSLPAHTYKTSVKHPPALNLVASSGNTKMAILPRWLVPLHASKPSTISLPPQHPTPPFWPTWVHQMEPPHGYYPTSGPTHSHRKKPSTAHSAETKTQKLSTDTPPPSHTAPHTTVISQLSPRRNS
jgi:hypothetical protein